MLFLPLLSFLAFNLQLIINGLMFQPPFPCIESPLARGFNAWKCTILSFKIVMLLACKAGFR